MSGEYVLEVGRGGEFVVSFDTTVEGLVPHTFYNGVFANHEATRVQVAEGETVSGIDEAIQEGGRITGRVQNKSTKAPIQGIQACAELPDVDQSGVEPHRTCATTDASGEYAIESLTPGEGEPEGGYAVEFTSTLDYIKQFYGGGLENYSSTLIPIVLGETVPNIDAELEEGSEISGRVTSHVNGQPVAGARACAGGTAVRTICATTNAAGEYTIGQLMSGEYTVSFGGPSGLETEYIGQYYKEKERGSEAEPVSVTAPQKVSGIDASLEARGGIAGIVTSKLTHEPIAGVKVCTESQTPGGSYETCENSNSKGEYQIHGLLAGNYSLAFWVTRINEEGSNYLSQPHGYAVNPQANSVSVAMGSTTTADDELVVGGRISGEVTNVKTKRPAGGWPCFARGAQAPPKPSERPSGRPLEPDQLQQQRQRYSRQRRGIAADRR
ncbi:MAG TPA: carboxypeptidase regulatory-like domain-containing protein [Solirubrobacteraceae bacterium]|nr:carboxypeptidase regulatory-like domain-containing protein [Solirubrobacteraceae bacterium]